MLELELIEVEKQFILVKLLKLKGRNERRRQRRWYVRPVNLLTVEPNLKMTGGAEEHAGNA